MRKSWSVVCLSLLLVGCSSNGSSSSLCAKQFWNGTIGTCLPETWQQLSDEALDNQGVPEETVLAFQSTEARDGQFDTVTVTEEPLPQDMNFQDYGEANMLAVSSLPDYSLKDKREITIDGADAILHIFAARPVPEKPIRRYYQTSVTKGNTGYTFTGALPLSITPDDEEEIVAILRNVTLKNPNADGETSSAAEGS